MENEPQIVKRSSVQVQLIESLGSIQSNIIRLKKREDGTIYYVLAEGTVANLLRLPTPNIKDKTVKEALGPELASLFEPLFEKAFSGQVVQYTYQINGLVFVTLLVPQIENGVVINVQGTSIDITEQKHLQQKVTEREKLYRLITENSSDIIALISNDGSIKYISNAVDKLLGYKTDDFIGKNVFDFIHQDDYDRIYNLFIKALNEGTTQNPFELRIKKLDGSDLFLEAIANNHLSDPVIQAIIVNARDISDRKEAMKKLEESEERFRTMVVKLPSGTLYRKDDRIWINKRSEEITGYKSEELPTIDVFFEKLFGKRAEDIISIYNKDRSSGFHRSRIFPIVRKDDSIRYIKFSAYIDDKHEFWILHDVTDLTEMQNKLIAANNLLESIFEATKDAIIIAEPIMDDNSKIIDFKYVHSNKSAELISGLSNGLRKDKTLLELFPEIVKLGIFDKYVKVVERNIPIEFEFNRIVNGKEVWAHFYATPFRNGIMIIFSDITKNKKNEEDLKNLIEQLNKSNEKLQHNTEELQKLYSIVAESENQLKKSIASKDKFFGIIAHDLKNSISGFISLTQVITKDFHNIPISDLNKFIFSLKESADNLYTMLDNLLLWSRLQRGILEYKPEKINLLYELKENYLDIFNNDLIQKKITLNNLIDKDIEVYADKNMTRIIIQNLISNAIKFSNLEGNININCEYYDNKSVIFTIEDNGIGMSSEILDKIFKIDANISRRGTMQETGSGIGLIITKELIDIQNGKVWVESYENKGTTFRFTLPIKN